MAFVGTILFFNPYIYQIAAAAAAPLAQILRWTAKFGGTGTGDIGNGVASDIYGNVYVGGNFTSNPVSFYSSNGAAFGTTFTNSGSNDALVVQYDTNGNVGWAARIQGAGNDQGLGIATDLGANVYACGTYGYPNASFYSSSGASYGTIANPANGQTQAYVVKYNSAGLIQWAARMTTSGTTNGCGTNGVATDSSGYVYTVGSFSCTTLNIYNAGVSGTLFGTLANSGGALNNDTMIVKYDTNGNVQWTARIGSVSQNDFGTSIAVDSGSNVYITEWGTGNPIVVYHANGATFQTISQTGSNDCILVKYNSAGTAQWVSRYYSSGFDITNGVAVDSSLNVYVTGVYNSPFTAYNSDGTAFSTTNFISATNGQTYLIKYNTSGFVQWVATSVNSASYNYSQGQGVVTDGSNVYSTGYYSGGTGLQVYNSSGSLATTLPNSGGIDGFITKYDTTGTVQWAYPVSGLGTDEGFAITVDINLNLYVTGSLTSNIMNVAYGAGQVVQTASGAQNGFLVKLALPSSTLNWATHVGGNGNDFGQAIASDLGSNVYVTGYYSSTSEAVYNSNGTTFGTLANAGTNDCFIVKYNTIGAAQWATHVGGTGGDIGYSIAVDSGSNVYVTGYYASNPVTIYNSGGTTFGTLANAGSYNAFIVKYNTSGTAQWATRIGGTGNDFGQSIAVDSGSNVYVTGNYTSNPVTIYNSNGTTFGTLANAGSDDCFIVKYNTSGTAQWATRIGGTGNDFGYSIAVDSGSNVYVTGYYTSNPVTIYNSGGTTFGTLANAGSYNAFIVKYNTSGTAQWATRIGGTGLDFGQSIAVDSGLNVYVTGYYTPSPVTIYNSDGTSVGSFNSILASAGFTVKYNASGFYQWIYTSVSGANYAIAVDSRSNVYVAGSTSTNQNQTCVLFEDQSNNVLGSIPTSNVVGQAMIAKFTQPSLWAARIGGSTSNDYGFGIAIDSGGNICVVGSYNSNPLTAYNADGSSFSGTLATTGTNSHAFIVKYSTTGVVQWTSNIGGTNNNDYGKGIATDPGSNIYVTGYYASSPVTVFNAGGGTFGTLTNSGSFDVFVVKYNSAGTAQWATRIAGTSADQGNAIAADYGSNVYVTGTYSSNPLTVYNFNGTTFGTLSLLGLNNCFIVKYNTTGTAQWSAIIGGTSADQGNSIATDSSGSVCVAGQYMSNPVTIYNASGTTFGTLSNSGSYDAFIVKYNTTGAAQWATRIAGSASDIGQAITVDTNLNVYVTGYYQSNPVTIYNANGTTFGTFSGISGCFIVKYSTTGAVQWATRMIGGPNGGTTIGNSIATDSSGNVYVTGQFSVPDALMIYNSNGTLFGKLSCGVQTDCFIVKYNTNGIAQIAYRITGTLACYGLGIAADSYGSMYATGYHISNSISVCNQVGTALASLQNTNTNSSSDAFVVKIGAN